MSVKETLEKAYGNIPKEPQYYIDMSWGPTYRGLKYYWYKFIRKVTR